jgi:hypothetical protein
MSEELMKEAEALGINASLYFLLPPEDREKALRKDIARAKQLQSAADAE